MAAMPLANAFPAAFDGPPLDYDWLMVQRCSENGNNVFPCSTSPPPPSSFFIPRFSSTQPRMMHARMSMADKLNCISTPMPPMVGR
jgi:hypothetical protein